MSDPAFDLDRLIAETNDIKARVAEFTTGKTGCKHCDGVGWTIVLHRTTFERIQSEIGTTARLSRCSGVRIQQSSFVRTNEILQMACLECGGRVP